MDAERAVVLEEDHPVAGTEPGRGPALIGDLAAGDEDPHGVHRTPRRPGYARFSTESRRSSASARYRNGVGGEFETGNLTILLLDAAKIGREFAPSKGAIALRVGDVEAARTTLENRGVRFHGEIIGSGVCHQAIFEDPDGNMLILHHRYAPPDE